MIYPTTWWGSEQSARSTTPTTTTCSSRRFDDRLSRHDKIRLLYVLGSEFTGYEAEAMWDDTKLGLKTFNSYERMADRHGRDLGAPVDQGVRVADPGRGPSVPRRRTGCRTNLDHGLSDMRFGGIAGDRSTVP